MLKKGNKVFISGRLQTRQWEAQDGQQRNVTEIVIEDMILLTPKSASDYTQAEEAPVPEVAPGKEVKEIKESEPEEEKVEKEEKKDAPAAPTEEVAADDLPF